MIRFHFDLVMPTTLMITLWLSRSLTRLQVKILGLNSHQFTINVLTPIYSNASKTYKSIYFTTHLSLKSVNLCIAIYLYIFILLNCICKASAIIIIICVLCHSYLINGLISQSHLIIINRHCITTPCLMILR